MKYQIVPLGAQGYFELNGVRFDGGSFMYWKKNTTVNIKRVIIVFDKNNENIEVLDGIVVLSLKGLTNYQNIVYAIRILIQVLKFNLVDVQFQFVVSNDNQRQIAENLGKELGFLYNIIDKSKIENSNIKEVENRLDKERNYTASGSKTIELQKNTGIEKVTVNDNKAYINNGTLSIDEQKYLLLQKWQKDPFMSVRIRNLDMGELDRLLMENVTNNLTTYRMESAREQLANDKVGEVAMDKAINEDGLVNTKLGIIENNVSNPNRISAVEQSGANVQVLNPNIISSKINSVSVSSSSTSTNVDSSYVDVDGQDINEKSREVISNFYVDDEYNVYDSNGNVVGKIGQAGLLIDYNNNILVKNGHVMGEIVDYNDIGRNNKNEKSKPNVKVLRKKDEYKSAAFISLPVIMFILSAMLLVASVVLLFVLD